MIDFLGFALPFIGRNFLKVLPLLLITIPLAEWLKRSRLAERYVPALRARPILAILAATAIGAISPLCSCGVIPVIAGFLRAGLPLGPVMAFWIASPSMDPEIFALSAGMLGLPLAVGRLLATGALSLFAGLLAHYLETKGFIGAESLRGAAKRAADHSAARGGAEPLLRPGYKPALVTASPLLAYAPQGDAPQGNAPQGRSASLGSAQSCNCSSAGSSASASLAADPSGACDCSASARIGSLAASASEIGLATLREIPRLAGIMLLAFLLEALVIRFIPMDFVASLLGSSSRFGIPLATAVGVPLYATNLAALGLVRGLLENGMSGGAALAFLIGGAATTVPAMTAVWSLVKPRVFLVYVGTILAGALLSGYAWELLARLG